VSKSYTYCAECGELRVHDRESDGTYVTLRPCRCEREPEPVPAKSDDAA